MHHIDNMYTYTSSMHATATRARYIVVHQCTPTYTDVHRCTIPVRTRHPNTNYIRYRKECKTKSKKEKKKVNIFFHFFTIKNKKLSIQTLCTYQYNGPQRTQQYFTGLLFTVPKTCNATTATIFQHLIFAVDPCSVLYRIY